MPYTLPFHESVSVYEQVLSMPILNINLCKMAIHCVIFQALAMYLDKESTLMSPDFNLREG